MFEKSTDHLEETLTSGKVSLDEYWKENASDMLPAGDAFSSYFRETLKRHGNAQNDTFVIADIPERYGYKLVSGEKKTRKRDLILRLCLAGSFSLEETNRALKMYGFSPLYARDRRDAVIITCINTNHCAPDYVNELLQHYRQLPLASCGTLEDE